jgi:predicted dehydrogenase
MFRAVLAGCGGMAKGWLKALRDAPELQGRVAIVGLVDIDIAAADRLKAEFGLDAATGTSLDGMLSSTKPDIVFDVVIPAARRDVVLTALKHGCHVLTEKPMATSLDEARELIAAATRAGRVHAVVQNRRYVEGVRRIRQVIADGTLGELTALHADFFIGAHFGGFRDAMEHPLLLDMAIHTFDAARYMSGADPLAVYALETNPRGSWYAHGAAANGIFEFSDDIVFTYRGSWAAEGATTSWESQWRVIGTKGTLLWDGADQYDVKIVAGDSGFLRPLKDVAIAPAPHPSQTHGHASVLAEFLDAIETGRAPETAGADNIKSLGMVFGAIDSARLHQRVSIAA